MRSLHELTKLLRAASATLRDYRGSLRRLRPATLTSDASDHLERLKAESEGVLRLARSRAENERLLAEIRGEKLAERKAAARVARHHAREVRVLAQEARESVKRLRRDVSITFPDVENFSPDARPSAELLRLAIFDRLSRASVDQLYSTLLSALDRRDLRGRYETEAVRDLAEGAVASSEADLPVLHQLRDHLEGLEDLRVPSDFDLASFEELEREADKLDARAELLGVDPVDPKGDEQAAAEFDRQRQDLADAGAATDAEDHAALRRNAS